MSEIGELQINGAALSNELHFSGTGSGTVIMDGVESHVITADLSGCVPPCSHLVNGISTCKILPRQMTDHAARFCWTMQRSQMDS